MMQNLEGSIGPLVTILIVVLTALWIALPFAVFGKKPLDAILVELKKRNRVDR